MRALFPGAQFPSLKSWITSCVKTVYNCWSCPFCQRDASTLVRVLVYIWVKPGIYLPDVEKVCSNIWPALPAGNTKQMEISELILQMHGVNCNSIGEIHAQFSTFCSFWGYYFCWCCLITEASAANNDKDRMCSRFSWYASNTGDLSPLKMLL